MIPPINTLHIILGDVHKTWNEDELFTCLSHTNGDKISKKREIDADLDSILEAFLKCEMATQASPKIIVSCQKTILVH